MSQLKSGAILSYLSIFITFLIALIYTPIMIRILGQAEYGLYALIGSFAAYFTIMDMGLGNAIVRYIARNRAIGNKTSESKLNGMFLVLYLIIGMLTIILGIIFLSKIDNIFGTSLSSIELEKAKIMIIILTFNYAISFPLSVFSAIMKAYEKFIVFKIVAITRSILVPIITIPILFIGYGSVAMVFITSVVNIGCLLFNVYFCIKYLKINLYFGKFDTKLLKEIVGYSFFILLNTVVELIYWNTDQLILGAIAGTIPVAIYAIAMQFIVIYKMFSTSISGLFLPKASIMVANEASINELSDLMIKIGRIQYIIMSFILSGFILFGYPFITIWAGEMYSTAYYIVLIIMIPITIPLIQNFGISVLQAKNLHAFRSIIYIIITMLNIILTIPLAKNYGGVGTAIATALSVLLGHIIIINIYYHRKVGLNMLLFWKNIMNMSLPVLLALLIGLTINYFAPQNTLILLLIKIIIFSIIFIMFKWKLGLNNYEKKLFISIIRKIIKVQSHHKQ